MDPIRMADKVDRYIANPAFFEQDLDNQVDVWMSHIVRPLGTAFEASEGRFDRVREVAQRRHQEHVARLAKIDAAIGIAMSVVFMATDVLGAAAASRAINVSRRFSTRRGLDTFRTSGDSFETAMRAYLNQTDTFSDILLGNIDSTLRGLVSTSSARSGVNTIRTLATSVSSSVSTLAATCDEAFDGPLGFQNNLTDFYASAKNSIYTTFVNEVRDGNGSAEYKRAVLESLIDTPFCRPPTSSLSMGNTHLEIYFEISRYCQLVATVASSGERHFGVMNDMGGHLADTINQRLLQLTRHYFDHRSGGRLIAEHIRYRPAGDLPLAWSNSRSGLRDFQVVWDGYCARGQSRYAKVILDTARTSCLDPYLDTIGAQSAQFYGRTAATAGAQ